MMMPGPRWLEVRFSRTYGVIRMRRCRSQKHTRQRHTRAEPASRTHAGRASGSRDVAQPDNVPAQGDDAAHRDEDGSDEAEDEYALPRDVVEKAKRTLTVLHQDLDLQQLQLETALADDPMAEEEVTSASAAPSGTAVSPPTISASASSLPSSSTQQAETSRNTDRGYERYITRAKRFHDVTDDSGQRIGQLQLISSSDVY